MILSQTLAVAITIATLLHEGELKPTNDISDEGKFELEVNAKDCQMLSIEITTVAEVTDLKEGLEKLGYKDIDGETPVVVTLIISDGGVYSLCSVQQNTETILLAFKPDGDESDIPRPISETEYDTYAEVCTLIEDEEEDYWIY
ncbi:unnamed protein product [Nippostrongylus brasiliensis]|uniref:DUF4430 domain-containing protein n=1 Tax=Nippostrongylus brasiliensis TaxID=27835 RepID=A0A0N4XVY2_NIPBR|nr:hypothetical protein Q1695_010104 [Nippostrongylus brasiliensis]VDL70584.1 unnamed protein product [Nippostrongylus brasiliensis]